MFNKICSLPLDLEEHKEVIEKRFRQQWSYLRWGFSHGDLWVQDIFRSEDGHLCFLDWEWASTARPDGLDLFHLGISALEFGYRISSVEAVTCLIYGTEAIESLYRQELQMFWDELGYNEEIQRLSTLCYLLYIQYRVSIQCPRLLRGIYLESGKAFLMAAFSYKYLYPFVG